MTFKDELIILDETEREQRERDIMIKKTLQEKSGNPTMLGNQGFPIVKRLWQPHNYRLYFNFNRRSVNPTRAGLESQNHDSELKTKQLINGCKIIIRKNSAEVINKAHDGYYWHVYAYSSEDIDARIGQIVDMLDYECIQALNEFIRLYGGKSDLEIVKRRNENKLKGDEYIDNIPKNLIIEDYPYFKKVYENHTEIYGIENTRKFMRERMIDSKIPELKDSLIALHKAVNLYDYITSFIKHRTDVHEALNNDDWCNDFRRMTQEDKQRFEDYIFTLEE